MELLRVVELWRGGLLPVGLVLVFWSCRQPTPQPVRQVKDTVSKAKSKLVPKPGSSFEDSLVIDSRAVILFRPDSQQLEKIRAINEPAIYESLTHDCYFEMQNARDVVYHNWPGIRVIVVSKKRWLVFKRRHASRIRIDLNAINDICGMFLFDVTKDPVRADMPNVNSDMGRYFRSSHR